MSSRPQDSGDFAQGAGAVGEVAQAEGEGDDIECAIGERQVQGVALDKLSHASDLRLLEEGTAEIQTDDLGGGQGLEEKSGNVPRTAGEIENPGGRMGRYGRHELLPPSLIQPEAEEPVEAVV